MPPIDPEQIAAAEAILGIAFTAEERSMMAPGLERKVARYDRRRADASLGNADAPLTTFDPWLGAGAPAGAYQAYAALPDPGPLPNLDEDIAFAPVWKLAMWVRSLQLSSERLTAIYLDRIERYDGKLFTCITVLKEQALAEARERDAELAQGKWRGPLHGIPYGAKDLFDSANVRTTWGAEPWADRVPTSDATVVSKLREAGAVLLAKTSLGALAYGDRWLDKRTNNPWNTEQGSSGSSAGSAAGTAAGLFAFALGTETYGSIVSPSMRCGTTGLRPTFGRVSRGGAMALCWTLDKVGPITRSVRDTRIVLDAIAGLDARDPSTQAMPLHAMDERPFKDIRVGLRREWFEGRGASDGDRAGLAALEELGVKIVELELPEGPHDTLMTILDVEAASAFEDMTRANQDDLLQWQAPQAWPNTFRSAWMIPAIELVQADRYRRIVAQDMAQSMAQVDAVFGPSFAGGMLMLTNFTGHPCLVMRTGMNQAGMPQGSTLWAPLAEEGVLFRLGEAIETKLGVASLRPDFDAGE
jgi:Asp-tRNA(Asn)/Glu-tRNA(Gln) amidotransferase A subunit family amidase